MKKKLLLGLFLLSCIGANAASYKVADMAEYNKTVKTLQAGDSIVLSKGVWKDAQFVFFGEGTETKPITLTVNRLPPLNCTSI